MKKTMAFRALLLTIGLAVSASQALADYPDRPVRVIVSSAPGGGPDISTRIVVAELGRQMGKQFVVDNRPGATGAIGLEILARAAPDGYTFGQGNSSTLAISRNLMPKLAFDLDRDLQPIVLYATLYNVLGVAPSLPVKSVQELIDHARKNPGKLLFGSPGNGGSQRLSAELFKQMTGTHMVHVPYKAAQQAIADLIGGQVHLMFDNATSMGAHIHAGRVRGLAVTASTRRPVFPNLPTISESGVPGFEVKPWSGFIAPSGVSKQIINRLNAGINTALASPAVKDKFAAIGLDIAGSTPEEFAAFISSEVLKWATVIKNANIKGN